MSILMYIRQVQDMGKNGRKRCFDKIFVERLWWKVKYEEVYLNDYRDVHESVRPSINRLQIDPDATYMLPKEKASKVRLS
jgi:hypothetical protein